ncbi:hypothetical protein CXF80_01380 [Shewanella sp. Actino-trap-3]|jgi:hypothetical protein|uniref:hypothetical protein n=1 Tax=Shewanella sp. Actino-trap-3 TaxID=2058331 RepID=UPI000C345F29|nr:hypothetical protein [Shewanella sp. Actino-trap-3]PKG77081.1 hypothetical protein CXF80_01380 [Shewanella sp. Actino-trap-3]
MTPEIKKCADNLLIQSVILKSLYVNLRDDVDSESFDDNNLENSQELKGLRMCKSLETDNDKWIYKLFTVVGIRFLSPEDLENEDSVKPLLEVKAEFIAQYESPCELSEEEINQFGEKHVFYHVWPYWREILQSSCARLNISPIIIPPLRV